MWLMCTGDGQVSQSTQSSVLDGHVSLVDVALQQGQDVRNHTQVQHLHTVTVWQRHKHKRSSSVTAVDLTGC